MRDAQHVRAFELIELYALGSLAPDETALVEQHVQTCEDCRERLRDAETAVTAMIESGDLYEPPAALQGRIAAGARRRSLPSVPPWTSLAAAFLLGVLPVFWLSSENRASKAVTTMQSAAIASLVHSHFSHAPFTRVSDDAPSAKVIFPRDGSWFYVVIAAHASGLQVGTVIGPSVKILGSPLDVGGSSAYYTKATQHLNNIVLLRDGKVVARATVASR